jgi:hypothetical protein
MRVIKGQHNARDRESVLFQVANKLLALDVPQPDVSQGAAADYETQIVADFQSCNTISVGIMNDPEDFPRFTVKAAQLPVGPSCNDALQTKVATLRIASTTHS